MPRYLLLYSGPPTPPNPSHAGWPQWFRKTGDALVDLGSPMANGFVLHGDGTTTDDAGSLRGYGIIEAEGRSEALEMLSDHPLFAHSGYSIEVFEVPRR
jgi:hypothetical protein